MAKPLIDVFFIQESIQEDISRQYRLFLERQTHRLQERETSSSYQRPIANTMDISPENTSSGNFVFETIIHMVNRKNKNNRVYDERAVEVAMQEYFNEYIKNGCAYCELDHPDVDISNNNVVSDSFFVVKLKNVCARIVSYRKEGDIFYGKIEVLNTPTADIIKSLILQKCPVGISVRGFGDSYVEQGIERVCDNYFIICFDIVSNPSTYNAWLNPIKMTGIGENNIKMRFQEDKGNFNKKEKEKVEKIIADYIKNLREIQKK